MLLLTLSLLALQALLQGPGQGQGQVPAHALVIRGAHVLSTDGTIWREGVSVLVRDGRIAEIGEGVGGAPGIEIIDAEGLWLTPGLIDLHSHLVLYPYDQRSWNDQVLKESIELRTIRGVGAAERTLERGWTTLRELGTEGAGFADVALRDAVEAGLIQGPRILAVTRALVATGCYGPSGFAPNWDLPKGAQVADGPVGVRVAVREQIAAGADWIKVYADYRRKPGDPSTPTFSQEELDAICDEARSAGLKVSAHAVTAEAIRRAVRAGVATIEHGYEADAEVFALMAERGVALCPTLAANEAICRYRGWKPGTPEPARLVSARKMFRAALDSGVTIACGSDVGVFAHGENAREIELMIEYGMTPTQALAAATRVAADVISRVDLGRIEVGAAADLVVFGADPLVNKAAFRDVRVVISRGRRVGD